MSLLNDSLLRLAQDRYDIERQEADIALLELELQASNLYARIKSEKERLQLLVDVAKENDQIVRSEALTRYNNNEARDKYINSSISIAEYTTFKIDQPLAIAWASEHHHKGLKLNLAEIKKVAKAGMEVNGVVLGKENRVKIASDLSSYLSNE